MTTWFTADLHLGHANIIGYCNRPFPDVGAMNDGLVGRWNDSVADHDTVWVLGDVALGQIDHTLALVRRLAGHKQLLTGNHDRCWVGNGAKAEEWTRRYADAGFETIHQGDVVVTLDGVDDLGPSGLPEREAQPGASRRGRGGCRRPRWRRRPR